MATITGTAGWEALFRGKPSIVFGRAFYRGAPGVIAVDRHGDLKAALEQVEAGTFPAATPAALRRFLQAVGQESHHGVVDTAYLRDSDLTLDESVRRHTEVLIELLGSPAD